MIGRSLQIKMMTDALVSKKSHFIAVTGRRRVGKTYIIDQVFEKNICLRVTGIQDASMEEQITNFTIKLAEYSNNPIPVTPNNWQEVMHLAKNYLKTLSKNKKHVLFIDELPWMATKRSGFIQLLAHLWNDYMSKEKHFILVICGSATSWIAKKIVNDRGGFHNRLTARIELKPFTLAETKAFLKSRGIHLTDQAIAELYMIMGGIPYYLEQIKKGESVAQIIARLCFSETGVLRNEYNNLYKALFENPENHEAIVAALAKSTMGLNRSEILAKSKVDSGGPYTRAMEDLMVSGFVQEVTAFGRKKRGSTYRLMDEYSVFYHKFIKPNSRKNEDVWKTIYGSQAYASWAGFAFETLCHRHIDQIKSILGISGIYTEHYSYRKQGNSLQQGSQIDLVIDRKDKAINLCECKFYNAEYTITKEYAEKLRNRKQHFINDTKTKKSIYNTLITNYGLAKNEYYLDVVDTEIEVSQLMV